MTKLSLPQIFSFILIILVIVRTSEAAELERCEKVLRSTNCNLPKCQKDCFLLYRNFRGSGHCLGNGPYACVCIYDCFAKKFKAQVPDGLM
ncbi:hypothetical protein CR513_46836, partial [Mucuna pruriens]